MKKSAF